MGHVIVDDMAETLDIQPPRRHVRRHDDIEPAVPELVDGALALLLLNIAVEWCCRVAARLEFFRELHGSDLGAHEDDRCIDGLRLEYARQRIQLVGAADHPVALADGLSRCRLLLYGYLPRLPQVLARYAQDILRHGRRKQRYLAILRGLFEHPLDILDKAHAQHLVGLVEHQRLELIQFQRALAHVIDDASGGAHHHVYAAL